MSKTWIPFVLVITCLQIGCNSVIHSFNFTNLDLITETKFGIEPKATTKDGLYIIFKENECGTIDTLLVGKITRGKRSGKWIYSDPNNLFPCTFKADTTFVNTYENGMLKSSREMKLFHIETVFEGTSIDENQNWSKKIYHNRKDVITIDSMVENKLLRRDFSSNGNLLYQYSYENDTITYVTEYHPNGKKSKKYKTFKDFTFNPYKETIDGIMNIYDENGTLIESNEYLSDSVITTKK